MDELTQTLLSELYEQNFIFIDENNQPIHITPGGSLPLMSLGYKATIAIRKARGWEFIDGKIHIPDSFTENTPKNE